MFWVAPTRTAAVSADMVGGCGRTAAAATVVYQHAVLTCCQCCCLRPATTPATTTAADTKQGIIHRDIKPDNIAIQADHHVALFDWNEALLLDSLTPLSDKQLAQQVGGAAAQPAASSNHS